MKMYLFCYEKDLSKYYLEEVEVEKVPDPVYTADTINRFTFKGKTYTLKLYSYDDIYKCMGLDNGLSFTGFFSSSLRILLTHVKKIINRFKRNETNEEKKKIYAQWYKEINKKLKEIE